MSLEELRPHLHALPEHPDWIPYRTSYYAESWGFCLVTARSWRALPTASTRSSSTPPCKTARSRYGECVLPGRRCDDEFLISVHICHPSLANDNLVRRGGSDSSWPSPAHRPRIATPIASCSCRARSVRSLGCRRNQAAVERVKHGLVLACVGDRGGINYKRSRRLSADIDRAVEHVLRQQRRAVRGPGFLSLRLR